MNVNQRAISMTRLKYRSAGANSAAAALRWSGSLASDPDAFAMDVSGMLLAFFRQARGATASGCKRAGQGQRLCVAPALLMTGQQEKTLAA